MRREEEGLTWAVLLPTHSSILSHLLLHLQALITVNVMPVLFQPFESRGEGRQCSAEVEEEQKA